MIRQHILGSVGLSHAEITLIQTVIRLSSEQAVGYWDWMMDIDNTVRLDGLLVDGQKAIDPTTLNKAKHVLFIGEPLTPPNRAYQVMKRPIRADALIQWLIANTEGFETAASAIQESETPPSIQGIPPDISPKTSSTPQKTLTTQIPTDAEVNFSRTAVKLTRWPHSQLLHKDPGRIRMATLLAKRPLTAGALAVISGQSIVVAEQFLHDLQVAGMLQLQPPGTSAHTPLKAATATPTDADPTLSSLQGGQLDTSLVDKLLASRAQQEAIVQIANNDNIVAAISPIATNQQPSRAFFQGLRQRLGL